jgi:hypothetical protein
MLYNVLILSNLSESIAMRVYLHKDCGEPAVETPDTVLAEIPQDFPFTCLSCLGEIEDPSDIKIIEVMSQ